MTTASRLKDLIKHKVSNNRAKVVMLGLVDEIVEELKVKPPKAKKTSKKVKGSKKEVKKEN